MFGGYLITGSALLTASERQVATLVSLTDFWFLCPRITLLRTDGSLSKIPVESWRCVRCLAEEKRRYRYPGRIFPSLANAFWKKRKESIEKIEDRLAFNLSVLEIVDRIISPSRFLRDIYIQSGIPASKISYIRQGRDFPNLSDDVRKTKPSANLRIGYLGQIAPHKGVDVLIKALRSISNPRLSLMIYGNVEKFPGYMKQLERICGDDQRIEFKGSYTSERQLTRILEGIDIVVVPSVWYENSPNTILEAFAHYTPVVASDIGGISELVEDNVNGLLFSPGDVDQLAEKLHLLHEDPQLVINLQRGIKPVRTVDQEMDDLEEIYTSAVLKDSVVRHE
jgi:glycosyltransferase involved in cell wall biosynthesis